MSAEVTTLDNGLRIVTERNPAVETASLGLWIDAGSRVEDEASSGIAHMLEHMVFKGTAGRSAQAIAAEIEDVGGHLNAYTGREQTGYYAKVLKDDVALAVDLTTDLAFAAALEPEELERERTVILQEIGQANDTPDDIIFDHLQAVAFPRQGLGRPVLGTPETVSSIPRSDLAAFRDRWYRPSRMVFAAAGNIEHARIVDEVARRVAERCPQPAPDDGRPGWTPATYVGGVYGEARDLEQTHLVIAWPGASFADPGIYALSVYAPCSAAACPRGCSRKCGRSGGWSIRSTPSPSPSPTRACSPSTPAPARTTWTNASTSSAPSWRACRRRWRRARSPAPGPSSSRAS
jgi:predicted Zn-dependent peptidase